MFSRTLASWGRLFRREQAVGPAESAGEDGDRDNRRVWTRFACAAQAAVTRPGNGEHLEGEIQNVSRGGANLLSDRAVMPGELLSVHLPGAEGGSSTVLACVLRCEPAGEGCWSLGCSFSSELSEDDLHLFAGKPLVAEPEQRARERFACGAQVRLQVVRAGGIPPRRVQVRDISTIGIALEVPDSLQVGELLHLELCRGDDSLVVATLASVVRVTVEPDGQHVAGCNFIGSLTEEQLSALV
jgi:hypothetical protein